LGGEEPTVKPTENGRFYCFKKVAAMARIGRKGRLWLRAFHIFFMGSYVGGNIITLVIFASAGSAQSDGGLQAMYQICDKLSIPIAPCAIGTLVTGLLLSWLTPWGFFKHKWVIYTFVVTILVTLVYLPLMLPLTDKLASLVDTGGLGALQNPEYIGAWNRIIIIQVVYLLLLISMIFISVIKPWEKRERAEATS
jgi:uncharacterized membrane protein